jgi:hypothetical protein
VAATRALKLQCTPYNAVVPIFQSQQQRGRQHDAARFVILSGFSRPGDVTSRAAIYGGLASSCPASPAPVGQEQTDLHQRQPCFCLLIVFCCETPGPLNCGDPSPLFVVNVFEGLDTDTGCAEPWKARSLPQKDAWADAREQWANVQVHNTRWDKSHRRTGSHHLLSRVYGLEMAQQCDLRDSHQHHQSPWLRNQPSSSLQVSD